MPVSARGRARRLARQQARASRAATYREAWARLRFRYLLYWCSWLSPVVLVPLSVALRLPGWLLGAVCMGSFVGCGVWLMRFRCPRCHRSFLYSSRGTNLLARECRHCGLPKWET